MHYVPIIDPGISASEPPGTYIPWDEGLHLEIFIQNQTNQPFIGKVCMHLEFLQPLSWRSNNDRVKNAAHRKVILCIDLKTKVSKHAFVI